MGTYEDNLFMLRSHFPEVAEWLARAEEDPRIELVRARTGDLNLRIRGVNGKGIIYYEMDDPRRGEEKLCERVDFSSDKVTLLIGFGLGYVVDTIRKKMKKGHRIVVFEKNPTILKRALEQTDIAALLKDGEIVFSLPAPEEIKRNVQLYGSNRYPEDILVFMNRRLMEDHSDYLDLKERVMECVGSCLMMVCTAVNNGPVFAGNEMANLPKFLLSPGIKNLADRFKGVPAIIVAAGPSLEKNIHKLKAAKGKALLIATAPVVRVLLAHGIPPDLIVSIDFNEDNRIHFEGLCASAIPLVHPIKLASSIVRDYQGDLFGIQDPDGICRWLGRNWEFKGFVRGGGSVSVYAIMTALFYGCDPVIFVGQDLAYTDRSHIDGVFLAERIDRQNPGAKFIWVEGLFGETVPTIPPFISYRLEIEAIIERFADRTFINATEGGARIQGAQTISLREAIERACGRPIAIESILREAGKVEPVDFAAIVAELRAKGKVLKEMEKLCRRGLATNRMIGKRMARGLLDTPETDKAILDNWNQSVTVQRFCESFEPAQIFLRKETFQINRQEYIYAAVAGYEKKKDLEIGLERNRLILGAARKALREVQAKISGLLEICRQIALSRRRMQRPDPPGKAHARAGTVLAAIGAHRRAAEEFEKALARGQGGSDLLLALARSCLHLERLTRAEEVLRKAQREAPGDERIPRVFQELGQIKKSWLSQAEEYWRAAHWTNALLYAGKILRQEPLHPAAAAIAAEAEKARDRRIAEIEETSREEERKRGLRKEHAHLIKRSKEFMGEKNCAQAEHCLEEARALGYDELEVDSVLACCYAEKGEVAKARRLSRSLAARFPGSGLFHFNLGRGLIRNDRLLEAARELETAAAKEMGKFYNGLFEAGAIYLEFQKFERAVGCFEAYFAVSPDSFEILGKIGTCYLAQGKLDKAEASYREALKIQPGYEAARVALEKIAESKRQDGRACSAEVPAPPPS